MLESIVFYSILPLRQIVNYKESVVVSKIDKKKFEARAQFIKAMAHPSRLIMIDALTEGELCVCELKELVGADMSTVSKHLSLLKSAGLVNVDKRGLKVFYSLRVPCVDQFMNCVDKALKTRAEDDFNICC